jgi:hypothetical protein
MTRRLTVVVSAAALLILTAGHASADTTWTDWTTASNGAPGSASGTLTGITVSYSGELDDFRISANSGIWAPNSSFVGGTSTASPSTVNDDLRLNGSFTGTNTITFGSPITNPLIAIWSLGAPGLGASFTFNATPTFEVGGPNSQFGGSPISVVGNTVTGNEGNGVVQFTGTFTSISWTDTFENFYAFTVGTAGTTTPQVPEPSTLLLLGASVIGLGIALRRARRP